MSMRFSDDWEGFTKAAAEANRLNKIIVFDALSKARITHVIVGFDSEDDRGKIGRPVPRSDEEPVELPPDIVRLWVADFGCTELRVCELNLQVAVEYLCYDYLKTRHGGWEISEGSVGEFAFDVATQTVTLDFYGRLIDRDYLNHFF